VSSYVSCSGDEDSRRSGKGSTRILSASCSPDSLAVTPQDDLAGGNFKLQFEIDGNEDDRCGGHGGLGSGDKRILDVDVFPEQTIAAPDIDPTSYSRWNGRLVGRVLPSLPKDDNSLNSHKDGSGQPFQSIEYEGVGIYEQFVRLGDIQ
jgi:hypothetical protein